MATSQQNSDRSPPNTHSDYIDAIKHDKELAVKTKRDGKTYYFRYLGTDDDTDLFQQVATENPEESNRPSYTIDTCIGFGFACFVSTTIESVELTSIDATPAFLRTAHDSENLAEKL